MALVTSADRTGAAWPPSVEGGCPVAALGLLSSSMAPPPQSTRARVISTSTFGRVGVSTLLVAEGAGHATDLSHARGQGRDSSGHDHAAVSFGAAARQGLLPLVNAPSAR